MWHSSYLIHFNKNHDKNGRFTSGDGDGDGIIDDHHNYAKNKQAQSNSGAGGGGSLDSMIGDQIDEMVKKYNNPTKYNTNTNTTKKKNNKKKKTSGRAKKKSTPKVGKVEIKVPADVVGDNKDKPADTQSNVSPEEIEKLIEENKNTGITFLQYLLGK